MLFSFQISETDKIRIDILSTWYGVTKSAMVRNVIEDKFYQTQGLRESYKTYNDLLLDNGLI